ncbi:MAG: oligosaccharide flippase family protein [Rhizobiaceae bacterium]|nr:oligosaccharide flippase family protein [Rhizobiaceae bacterium]
MNLFPFARLKSNRLVRSVALLVSANVAGQLLLLAAMPIVTRLCSPEDFGVFGAFSGILNVLLVASSLRYEFAVPLAKRERDARAIVVLALVLNALIAGFAAGAVLLFPEQIAGAMHLPDLAQVLWLLPVVLLGAGTYRSIRMWSVRRREFGAIAYTRIAQSAANGGTQIGLGLAGFGATGLIVGQLLGFSAGTLRLARTIRFSKGELRPKTILRRMSRVAVRFKRFPQIDTAASILNTISTQLPMILLPVLFGPVVAGYYALADRALASPASLLSQAMGQVILSESSDRVASGNLGKLATRAMLGVFCVAALPTLLMFLFGEPIVTFVFGADWGEAGAFIAWMALGTCAQLIYSSISTMLLATEAQARNLVIQLSLLVIRAIAILLGYMQGAALSAIVFLSIANAAGYSLACLVVIAHARRFSISKLIDTDSLGRQIGSAACARAQE